MSETSPTNEELKKDDQSISDDSNKRSPYLWSSWEKWTFGSDDRDLAMKKNTHPLIGGESNEVIRDKLWVCSLEEAKRMCKRMDGVISLGVDLTDEIRFLPSFEHLFINVKDDSETNLTQHFERCNKFISTHNKVLVHCQAGISRSVTIVAAYLISRHEMCLTQAMSCISVVRPQAYPNEGFIRQLEEYERNVRGSG